MVRRTLIVAAAAVLALGLAWLAGAAGAHPAPPAEAPAAGPRRPVATAAIPATCRLGAFVTSLHGIDTARNRFSADFWLWSLCADPERRPLETIEFFNADEARKELGATMARGGQQWGQVKVMGTFRHRFDLRNYPFDRHRLVITLEEAVEDASAFAYRADVLNSGLHEGLRIEGWRIDDFRVKARETLYR